MFLLRRFNFRRTSLTYIIIFIFTISCVLWTFKNDVFTTKNKERQILSFKKYGKKYCVMYDFWKAEDEYYSGDHITLILHSTVDYLSYLKKQDETWDGGISFTLYIPTYNDTFISDAISETIMKLNALKTEMNSTKITLHLFFQMSLQRDCPENVLINAKKLLFELPNSRYTYPINVARNIGRKGSKTNFFISGDIEQIYVKNFEPRMLKLANKVLLGNQTRTVLVHRRFEMVKNVSIPADKNELKVLYEKQFAIPFHQKLYSLGHYIPNLHRWFTTDDYEDLSITETLYSADIAWEPQFVADSRTPFHDERFPYRFRSNAHVSNLLCMQNFTFSIVSDVFSVHRGITAELSPSKLRIMNRLKRLGVERMNRRFFKELQNESRQRFNFCFHNQKIF